MNIFKQPPASPAGVDSANGNSVPMTSDYVKQESFSLKKAGLLWRTLGCRRAGAAKFHPEK
jgi:hypothetical protein